MRTAPAPLQGTILSPAIQGQASFSIPTAPVIDDGKTAIFLAEKSNSKETPCAYPDWKLSWASSKIHKVVYNSRIEDWINFDSAFANADLRKQLSNVTLAGSGENIEVEIIPFEVLYPSD